VVRHSEEFGASGQLVSVKRPRSGRTGRVLPFRGAPRPDMTDRELLLAIGLGENTALRDLFYRHGNRVYRVLRYGCNVDPACASEAVRDAFLGIGRSASQCDERTTVSGWIVRVALKVAARFPAAESVVSGQGRSGDDQSPIHSAVLRLLEAESERQGDTPLEAEIARLPPGPRMAAVLIDHEGMSEFEVSDALGVSVRSVWRWVSDARWRLAPTRPGRPGLHLLARAGKSIRSGSWCPSLWKINRAIGDSAPRIAWHLSSCVDCQREHAVLARISQRLASLPRR